MHASQDVAARSPLLCQDTLPSRTHGAAVVVTGAGSGIGAATARLLGAAGACGRLVGRREDAAA